MSFQIFIRLTTGRHCVLDVTPETPISAIKQSLYHRQGIPSELQRLRYQSHYLTDNQTIGTIPISKEQTLHLSVRARPPTNSQKISVRPSGPQTSTSLSGKRSLKVTKEKQLYDGKC
jgi:hypothetical protein